MIPVHRLPCDEAAILHAATATPCPARGQRWTLLAAILGSSLAFVDGTVVNVALPAIQHDLGADAAQAQWVIESYALFLAALLLVGGALGDRYGRRRTFMLGVALFAAASAACAMAPTAPSLIAARALQGVGAALLVPGSLALISAAFAPAQRGQAIGTWSAFSGIAAAVGPVLGGWLIDRGSWTFAFLINVPIGLALLVICVVRVPESRGAASAEPIDVAGALLVTVGLAGLVFGLIEGPAQGFASTPVVAALVAGPLALLGFARIEARRAAPMLPLALFRSRNFTGTNLLTLLLYAALGGGLYFLPLNLIQVQGLGATAAGAALLPFVAIMFALSRWAGQLVDRFGPKTPLIIGPLIAAIGFALFIVPGVGADYWRTFFPAVCVLGLGMAITVAPLTTTVMNAVDPGLAGTASGVNNAVSRVGPLLAIAVFGLVMAQAFDTALTRELAALQLPAGLRDALEQQRGRLAGITLPAGLDAAHAAALHRAIGEAFVAGFRRVMAACAVLALVSAASAWWLIGRERARRPARAGGERGA